MNDDKVKFEVKGRLVFKGVVTSEPMLAIASDGSILHVPAGVPIPDWDCIEIHKSE